MTIDLFTVLRNKLIGEDLKPRIFSPTIENLGGAVNKDAIFLDVTQLEKILLTEEEENAGDEPFSSFSSIIEFANSDEDTMFANAALNLPILLGKTFEEIQDIRDVNVNFSFVIDDMVDPNLIFLNGTEISFDHLFLSFFGTYRSNIPRESYELSGVMPNFVSGVQKRLNVIKDIFPSANISITPIYNPTYLSSDYDSFYSDGLRNYFTYIERLGPYGDETSPLFVSPTDRNVTAANIVFNLVLEGNVRLLSPIGSDIPPVPPEGEEQQPAPQSSIVRDQMERAYNLFNKSFPATVPLPIGGSTTVGSLIDKVGIAFNHSVSFEDLDSPPGQEDYISAGFFDSLVDNIIELNTTEVIANKLFLRTNTIGVTAFFPEAGIISFPDEDAPTEINQTDEYIAAGQLFNLDLFNTSGCDLPPLPLSEDEIQAIQDVITGEVFRSPVEEAVNGVLSGTGQILSDLSSAIDTPLTDEFGNPLSTFVDSQGTIRVNTAVGFLSERINLITARSQEFQDHAYRLSGVSNYREGFNPGGGVGDLPGLVGIQSIAQSYNNIKNAIDSGNIGQALVDHYSPFFSSILGPGQALYDSIDSLVNGNIRGFLSEFPLNDGRLDLSKASQEQLGRLISLGNSTLDFTTSIRNLIDSDNATYFAALDYISKSSLGFSVLTMAEDPCFSQKLLGQIAKPDLKGLLNIT
jgi:hypothetical protein|tara:strand:+ start:305 stop:2377 length:2073 start_codon:yes stop_codon:yes gene_type:complete